MNTALLATTAGAISCSGLLLIVYGLAGSPKPRRPTCGRTQFSAAVGRLRRHGTTGAIAVAIGMTTWLLTGWPVLAVTATCLAAALPALRAHAGRRHLALQRLEALEEWCRRLGDILVAGQGLEGAIIHSLRSAPAGIRPDVHALVTRLQAHWPIDRALYAFADDLDDVAGDLVVAALILGARRRGASLSSVLDGLAESIGEEVSMRRKVEGERAKPRATARLVALLAVGAGAALTVFQQGYLEPYRGFIGQITLMCIVGAGIGIALWIRALSSERHEPRFLRTSSQRTSGKAR